MTTDAERPRLRGLRTELGWTQQEMAERLAHLAWMQNGERVGVNADMVAKWERGAKGISPRYRELLCRLFGVTADQLGLKNAPAVTGGTRSRTDDQSLLAMLDNAAGLLDQLGAAGTALAPHMIHAWKDAITTRRTMFGLLDPGATDPVGHARVATATVADLEHLAERYRDLYETADPAALLTSVAAHVDMAQDALRRDLGTEERRRRLRNLAEVAILAGRLAAEDLGNTMSARAYYSLVLDNAREAADDQLTAIAHGHAAHLAAHNGMSTAALDHLTAARDHAVSTPAVASWLASIEATIRADRGEHAAAREALDRARIAFDQPGGSVPAWFRWSTTEPYPFLAELADLRAIGPAAGQDRDSVQHLAHPVIAYSPTSQHVRQPVASFPSDGEPLRPVTVKKDPRCGCCTASETTVTAHRCLPTMKACRVRVLEPASRRELGR